MCAVACGLILGRVLHLLGNMAAEKVTVWTLESNAADAEYLGKLDVGRTSTLEALKSYLDSNEVLEWRFDFWDAEDRRRVRSKLERLNGFGKEVHVIRALGSDGNGADGNKHRRLGDGSFAVINADHSPEEAVQVEEATFRVQVAAEDVAAPPVGSSRVSGNTTCEEVDNNPLQSKLLPNAVTDRYLERAKKLQAEFKRVALDDHNWWVKTFDRNGCGVMKLWCAECKKDCGGCNTDHTKAQIENLFNNFRRSHIVNV